MWLVEFWSCCKLRHYRWWTSWLYCLISSRDDVVCSSDYIEQKYVMMIYWKECEIYPLLHNLKYHSPVCAEGLRQITENLSTSVLSGVWTRHFLNTSQQRKRFSQLAGWLYSRMGSRILTLTRMSLWMGRTHGQAVVYLRSHTGCTLCVYWYCNVFTIAVDKATLQVGGE